MEFTEHARKQSFLKAADPLTNSRKQSTTSRKPSGDIPTNFRGQPLRSQIKLIKEIRKMSAMSASVAIADKDENEDLTHAEVANHNTFDQTLEAVAVDQNGFVPMPTTEVPSDTVELVHDHLTDPIYTKGLGLPFDPAEDLERVQPAFVHPETSILYGIRAFGLQFHAPYCMQLLSSVCR
jgi:hypothetical protein